MRKEESSQFNPENCELPSEFIGERVLLRPYQISDASALLEVYVESREHFRPWIGRVDDIQSLSDAETAVKQGRSIWFDRTDLVVAIFDRETGRLLGESGLGTYWDSLEFELGFWLRASAQGCGYMTEANILLCDWAFTDLLAQRVFMQCDFHNLRSIAVARRLGLKEVKHPESQELRLFEMTADEYMDAPWIKK
ncbi:MAG: GNAT family N-acetyltransferase [Candidatus Poribacteria bacterium]